MRRESRNRLLAALMLGGVMIAATLTQAASGSAQQTNASVARPNLRVDFNRDIRPILSDKCFVCHGSDATAKKIKLRLDSEAAATAELGGGRRAIAPGQPDKSELVKRVTHADEDVRMPPIGSGRADEVGDRSADRVDQAGREMAIALGVRRSRPSAAATSQTRRVAEERD